jgi:hypothetical protein
MLPEELLPLLITIGTEYPEQKCPVSPQLLNVLISYIKTFTGLAMDH